MKTCLQCYWRKAALIIIPIVGMWLTAAPGFAQSGISQLLSASSAQNLLSNGGFEVNKPAYWDPSNASAEWSTEQTRTRGFSLKISGAGESSWAQNEAVRAWVGGIPGAGTPEIVVGGWVYTEGVNTAPGSDAEKFQLVFEFFDAAGADVLGAPVVMDLPQDQTSSGAWVELSSLDVGAINLPSERAATSVRISFRKGANATGAAYLEDIFIKKADEGADGWAGDWFNANMDAGDEWYYWCDGMSGGGDFPADQSHFMHVTSEQAHSGNNSLKIESNGVNGKETPAISQRVPVTPGEPVLFSFWVKHEGHTDPGEIGTGRNNLGITALWYDNLEGGSAGWGEIGGVDVTYTGTFNDLPAEQLIPLLLQQESSGWTQYAVIAYPKDGAVGVEMRLRYYHQFSGATYWDDVFIVSLGGSALTPVSVEETSNESIEIPNGFELEQNYPNPFNPTTTISFKLATAGDVRLDVYNMLGQRVKTLINTQRMSAGSYVSVFDASNLSSGVYLYTLRFDGKVTTRQMILLK